jgi:hypothetical protein
MLSKSNICEQDQESTLKVTIRGFTRVERWNVSGKNMLSSKILSLPGAFDIKMFASQCRLSLIFVSETKRVSTLKVTIRSSLGLKGGVLMVKKFCLRFYF